MRTLHTVLVAFAIALCIAGGCATRQADYIKGKADVCEVHHRKMDKIVVPLHYGLMSFSSRSQALYSVSTNAFPHAQDSLNPSCVVSSQREAVIYRCPECVRVRHQWETDYDSKH